MSFYCLHTHIYWTYSSLVLREDRDRLITVSAMVSCGSYLSSFIIFKCLLTSHHTSCTSFTICWANDTLHLCYIICDLSVCPLTHLRFCTSVSLYLHLTEQFQWTRWIDVFTYQCGASDADIHERVFLAVHDTLSVHCT